MRGSVSPLFKVVCVEWSADQIDRAILIDLHACDPYVVHHTGLCFYLPRTCRSSAATHQERVLITLWKMSSIARGIIPCFSGMGCPAIVNALPVQSQSQATL